MGTDILTSPSKIGTAHDHPQIFMDAIFCDFAIKSGNRVRTSRSEILPLWFYLWRHLGNCKIFKKSQLRFPVKDLSYPIGSFLYRLIVTEHLRTMTVVQPLHMRYCSAAALAAVLFISRPACVKHLWCKQGVRIARAHHPTTTHLFLESSWNPLKSTSCSATVAIVCP